MNPLAWLMLLAVSTTITAEDDVASSIQTVTDIVASLSTGLAAFTTLAAPYLTSIAAISSFISGKLGIEIDAKLVEMMSNLTTQFEKWDRKIDFKFDDLKGFVDRKHFEAAITDPTTILWTHAMHFQAHPTNESGLKLRARCELAQHTPMDILTKLENRLYSSDNTLEVQTRAFQFEDAPFQKTKTMVEYRMFQLMTVEAMCRGLYGLNATTSDDLQMKTVQTKFDRIVKNIREVDMWRRTSYWPETAEAIIKKELDKNIGDKKADAKAVLQTLEKMYPWDKFAVLIYDPVVGFEEHYINGNNSIMLFPYGDRNTVVHKWQNSGMKSMYDSKLDELQKAIRESYGQLETTLVYASMEDILNATQPIFSPPLSGLIKIEYDTVWWWRDNQVACEYSDPLVAMCQFITVMYTSYFGIAMKNTLVYITGY